MAQTDAQARKAEAAERVARMAAAESELASEREWQAAGADAATKPETPNLDAIRGAFGTTGAPKAHGRKQVKLTERADLHPSVVAALQIKRDTPKRGTGVKCSDADLVAYALVCQANWPNAHRGQFMEVAYYVDRLAFSRPAWYVAWLLASQVADHSAAEVVAAEGATGAALAMAHFAPAEADAPTPAADAPATPKRSRKAAADKVPAPKSDATPKPAAKRTAGRAPRAVA